MQCIAYIQLLCIYTLIHIHIQLFISIDLIIYNEKLKF